MVFACSFTMPHKNSQKIMQFQKNLHLLLHCLSSYSVYFFGREPKIQIFERTLKLSQIFNNFNHILMNKTLNKIQLLIFSNHSFANQHQNLLHGKNDSKNVSIWMKFQELLEEGMLYPHINFYLNRIRLSMVFKRLFSSYGCLHTVRAKKDKYFSN